MLVGSRTRYQDSGPTARLLMCFEYTFLPCLRRLLTSLPVDAYDHLWISWTKCQDHWSLEVIFWTLADEHDHNPDWRTRACAPQQRFCKALAMILTRTFVIRRSQSKARLTKLLRLQYFLLLETLLERAFTVKVSEVFNLPPQCQIPLCYWCPSSTGLADHPSRPLHDHSSCFSSATEIWHKEVPSS